jgi:glycosyltransferase involved in cell wall biosynthesis
VTDPSGYAAGGRAFLRGLLEEGAAVRLEPHIWNPREAVTPAELAALARLTETELPRVDASVQHTFGRLLDPYAPGRVRVGRTMFETDRIPRDWVARCNQMDEIWVPTAHNREAFAASGVDPDRLHVIPEPFELDRLDPDAAPLGLPEAHGTIFLAAFDWTLRKGWDVLLAAWAEAFATDDDATLVLKAWSTSRGVTTAEIGDEIVAFLRRLGHDPGAVADLVLVDDLLPTARMPSLYAACDAVVAPTRGEGWGRPLLEAMAVGRPVIATAWSGPAAFLDATVGWPVGYDLVPVSGAAAAEVPVFAGHLWAEPSVEGVAAAMREVHARPEEARARGAAARERAARYDHRAVARLALERLAALEPRRPAAPPGSASDGAPRVIVEGCLSGVSSLSGVNRELARALMRRGGLDLALVDTDDGVLDRDAPGMGEIADAAERMLAEPPELVVRQLQPPSFVRPAHGRLVQILHWEFGPIPPAWVDLIHGAMDEAWVASTYVRDWMLRCGVDPARVAVLPLGVDPERFHPGVEPMDLGDAAPGTRFLFVGGLHSRKGVDLLLEAWQRAFRRHDEATLVVKDFGRGGPYPANELDAQVRRMAADRGGPRVLHLSGSMDESAMPGLYAACDCLVHPYRGEAYGLTIAEAMACGLPAIVPDRGAARDFCGPETALLVPSREVEIPVGEVGVERMDRFPVVNEVAAADLVDVMRGVVAHPAAAAAVGARAAESVRRDHTWDRTAAVAAERIAALLGREVPAPRPLAMAATAR